MVLGAGISTLPQIGLAFNRKSANTGFANREEKQTAINEAAARAVVRKELFADPVIIEDVQLLQHEGNYICKIRAQNGTEGISVSNNFKMVHLYPIFSQ